MTAECTGTKLIIQGLDGRDVVGRFDGGGITSDRGWSLVARRGSDGSRPAIAAGQRQGRAAVQ